MGLLHLSTNVVYECIIPIECNRKLSISSKTLVKTVFIKCRQFNFTSLSFAALSNFSGRVASTMVEIPSHTCDCWDRFELLRKLSQAVPAPSMTGLIDSATFHNAQWKCVFPPLLLVTKLSKLSFSKQSYWNFATILFLNMLMSHLPGCRWQLDGCKRLKGQKAAMMT